MKSSVSIIIPNYNGEFLLKQNLSKVIQTAPEAEIIVVDDASTDKSVKFVKSNYPEVKIIQHQTNQRFAAACNSGVAAAESDIVILLNTDVIPHKDFLNPLIKPFEDEWVFAVGCMEHNGGNKFSGRAGGQFCQGMIQHWRCDNQFSSNTFWVSGGSGAFRRSMWNMLGGMDILYKPAYQEDRDICYRALKRNWKVVFAPNSIVEHIHETTNAAVFKQRRIEIISHKNSLTFIWKNITSTRMIYQHLLWLPFHLIVAGFRTRGAFVKGFILALFDLKQIIRKRKTEILQSTIKDETIFDNLCRN